MVSKKLTGVENIKEPKGLAVDSLRKILYVVDGGASARKLYAARIYHNKNGNVACEAPRMIAEGLTSDWVSVDFRGKVFFVATNQILALPVAVVTAKLDEDVIISSALVSDVSATDVLNTGANALSTDIADEVVKAETVGQGDPAKQDQRVELVYDGGTVNGVSMPVGLAVDGYRMFWSNGENGKKDGTVVQGFESPLGDNKVNALATNLPMAHGVCLTSSRVFYTDEENNVFSTKTNGGEVDTVTDKLQKPRGCVFDGDGTVFIADQGDNKIVSFAGAGATLGPRRLSLSLADIKEPFGLAVLHGSETYDNAASRSTAMAVAIVAILVGLFH